MATNNFPSDTELLRAEIAAAAARMIAEDGADYSTAKRKAVKQVLGNHKTRGEVLPDNAQVEEEVRRYNELFFADTQPARLLHLRKLALRLMRELAQYNPYLTGAVLNGTAGAHSDIHLHLFADSAKDVEIYLLNKNTQFEVSETPHANPRHQAVETVSFFWQQEGVHLVLYPYEDMRFPKSGAGRLERGDAAQVATLIRESEAA